MMLDIDEIERRWAEISEDDDGSDHITWSQDYADKLIAEVRRLRAELDNARAKIDEQKSE